MKKRIIISLIFISVVITGIFSFQKYSSGSKDTYSSEKYTYSNFLDIIKEYQEHLVFTNYTKISSSEGVTNHTKAFDTNLLLEKRKNDGVDGDKLKASKYEFYFLNNDKSTLYVVTAVFSQNKQDGIIFETITSPDDNDYIDKSYRDLDRPYIIDKYVGCKDYCVNIKTILLKPNEKISKSENIINLINEDAFLYKQLEKFITSL